MIAAGAVAVTAWRWPVEDPLHGCPAIIVLNGDQPARVNEAARLLRLGVGREVWFTDDPASHGRQAVDAGTRSNLQRLLDRGVPEASIRIVPGSARRTREELRLIAAELTRRRVECAVAVTSPIHTRRVRLLWKRDVGPAPVLLVRGAPDAGYTGTLATLREMIATLAVATGTAP